MLSYYDFISIFSLIGIVLEGALHFIYLISFYI